MDHNDVRKGITQARFNEKNSSLLYGEITIISILLGLGFKSWWVFGGVYLGLLVALNIKPIAIILSIILSLVWGLIGYGIGTFFDQESASIVLSIIGFLMGLGVHFSALEWAEDIGD